METIGVRPHKSVWTKAKKWVALHSNNENGNLWVFTYWQAQKTIFLGQSPTILFNFLVWNTSRLEVKKAKGTVAWIELVGNLYKTVAHYLHVHYIKWAKVQTTMTLTCSLNGQGIYITYMVCDILMWDKFWL